MSPAAFLGVADYKTVMKLSNETWMKAARSSSFVYSQSSKVLLAFLFQFSFLPWGHGPQCKKLGKDMQSPSGPVPLFSRSLPLQACLTLLDFRVTQPCSMPGLVEGALPQTRLSATQCVERVFRPEATDQESLPHSQSANRLSCRIFPDPSSF